MQASKRILVPIDWSELSRSAVQLASSLAAEYDAELTLLYALPLPAVMYGPPPESYLNHLLEELCQIRPNSTVRIRHLVAEGDPGAAIVSAARETNCDLIVLGTHGRTGLNRFLRPSVAEEVLRKAPCLVMTVRAGARADFFERGKPTDLAAQPSACPVEPA
jgi:nucleotide-binding universal stress UspA family protein